MRICVDTFLSPAHSAPSAMAASFLFLAPAAGAAMLILIGLFPMYGSAAEVEQACVAPLENLVTPCLNSIVGAGSSPPKACCVALEPVARQHLKCLCELVAYGASSNLTTGINVTLALHLPAACGMSANPNRCPGLLGIPASSPEAQIFGTATGAQSPSSSHSSSSSSSSGGSSSAPPKTSAGAAVPPQFWITSLSFSLLLLWKIFLLF